MDNFPHRILILFGMILYYKENAKSSSPPFPGGWSLVCHVMLTCPLDPTALEQLVLLPEPWLAYH